MNHQATARVPAPAAARGPGDGAAEDVERFALRTRSPRACEALALVASGGRPGRDLLTGEEAGGTTLDPTWGPVLARAVALGPRPDAWSLGARLFEASLAGGPPSMLTRRAATTWAQLLLRLGREDELGEVLGNEDVPITDVDRWALRTDLANPWRTDATRQVSEQQEQDWLTILNEVHHQDGLDPVALSAVGGTPYQRLSAVSPANVDGELVTVVMSAYRPERDILTAARSVLAQSWSNVELLVVDDASPPGSAGLLEEVAALDPRVRLVRAPRNGGTYEARNLALGAARGRWMTFQDSDDWTHPQRVQTQVESLLEDPRRLSCRTWTLRAFPDLTLTYVGYPPERLNASSLLFERADVVRLLGGFDATRKSADMELPLRLQALRPGSHRDLRRPSPLAITQLRTDSLSRTDAVPGWTRWTRLVYRDLYLEWHARIAGGRASARLPAERRPFPLPDPTWAPDRTPPAPRTFDVVVLGDLRAEQPRATRTLGVAQALSSALTTAVAHAEVPDPLTSRRPDLLPAAAAAVAAGRVGLTHPDEPDRARLLVVTDPQAVLHLGDDVQLEADAVLVVVDRPPPTEEPTHLDGPVDLLRGWTVAAVDRRCAEIFGHLPGWGAPASVRQAVAALLPADRRLDADLAVVVDPTLLRVGAGGRTRSAHQGRLVVGHHLPDQRVRWPGTRAELRAAYPDDLGVHLLQGAATPARMLGLTLPPPSWCSFRGTGMTSREFLSHLDVYVYQGTWDEAAEVGALEALAAGLPCVLPAAAAGRVGPGPVLCVPPEGVPEAVRSLTGPAPPGAGSTGPALVERRRHTWVAALTPLVQHDPVPRGVHP
ncbi:glycosyltransferase [Ornithinimicrobium sp. LYQ121]|uniref:glycosyltransferase n=1 Tax=Ornithinimicrobium sp. LYQ121 TaxID=3378801 RepID=UPI0038526BB2